MPEREPAHRKWQGKVRKPQWLSEVYTCLCRFQQCGVSYYSPGSQLPYLEYECDTMDGVGGGDLYRVPGLAHRTSRSARLRVRSSSCRALLCFPVFLDSVKSHFLDSPTFPHMYSLLRWLLFPLHPLNLDLLQAALFSLHCPPNNPPPQDPPHRHPAAYLPPGPALHSHGGFVCGGEVTAPEMGEPTLSFA